MDIIVQGVESFNSLTCTFPATLVKFPPPTPGFFKFNSFFIEVLKTILWYNLWLVHFSKLINVRTCNNSLIRKFKSKKKKSAMFYYFFVSSGRCISEKCTCMTKYPAARMVVDLNCLCCCSDGEGNGNPLWCSCLENPRDGGAWWPAVYGVAQSRTWLTQLSSSSSDG